MRDRGAHRDGWYGTVTDYQTVDPAVLAKLHDRFMERKKQQLHDELDQAVADIPNPVEMHVTVQTISVSDSLLDFAKHHDVDLIIMGCRGWAPSAGCWAASAMPCCAHLTSPC